ncbi:hypothetical protein [Bacillus sp. V5-8f]|uniref:hypothetical protein n=1 Tax=Bacillus sp. V5-8f TaxID=2053044 RepID=UPI000C76B189|nr:hypothetical protein [Bacillus sp. V5-8f]PLT33740.1 hypothetical protein CUU64_11530 [Bacillus sp. V5-8f]
MNGIVLLNPNLPIGQLQQKESLLFQKMLVYKLVDEWKVEIIKLNPYQIHEYYTIPHALLYDLKTKRNGMVDYLLLYSFKAVIRFQYIYPEKWVELESFFSKTVSVEQIERGGSEIIL